MIPFLPAMFVDAGSEAFDGNGFFGLLLMIAGVAGLRYSRKLHSVSRALNDTPVISVAQAGNGLVRVRGRIASDQLLVSPFTQTPCCFYEVEVEEPSDDGSATGMAWRRAHIESSVARFELRDRTGAIEIRPEGIQVHAPPTFRHEVISRPRDPSEERMLAYVREHCPNKLNRLVLNTVKKALLTPEQEADPQVQERLRQLEERRHQQLHRETKGHSFLFRETCFLPGQELEVVGTAVVDGASRALGKGPGGQTPFLLSAHLGEALNRQQDTMARNFTIASVAALAAGVLVMIFSLS